MAKQFAKKSRKSQQGQGLSAIWLCFLTFVFGYLAASWFDVNQFGRWVSDHVQSNPAQPGKPQMQAQAPEAAHPKLEFYTLLANESVSKPDTDLKTTELATAVEQQPKVAHTTLPSEPMELAMTQPVAKPVLPVPKLESPKPEIPKPLATLPPPRSSPAGAYSVQVGSFRALTEAQRMRAKLLMKGFHVNIVTVNQQSTYWYRVTIGPFASLSQAQQAQLTFARQEHITGMIRKLDV